LDDAARVFICSRTIADADATHEIMRGELMAARLFVLGQILFDQGQNVFRPVLAGLGRAGVNGRQQRRPGA
jgi:hypothetical protein